MRKLLTLALIASTLWASAQHGCDMRKSTASLSLHIAQESQFTGYGIELGEQGLAGKVSAFLGFTSMKTRIAKADSSIKMATARILYCFNPEGMVKISPSGGIAVREADLTYLVGVRILWVPVSNLGVSLEPLFTREVLQARFSIHLLL